MRIDLLLDINASLRELGNYVRVVDWQAGGRVHNWRNYVPTDLRARWADLSDDTRGAIYFMADEIAGREDWD